MKTIKLAENVLVPHPYEPILCLDVHADIFAFYYDDYACDADMWECVARMLCLKQYKCVYVDECINLGCLIAYRYCDKSLDCAHDIFKPFFEYFSDLRCFEYVFIERN